MRLKGSCEIHVVDSRTGKIKQVIKQENLVTNQCLISALGYNARAVGVKNISISTQTTQPSILNSALTKVIATGYVPSGIASPVYNASSNPPFGQIQNRIDFVGVDRTFYTVGLSSSGSSNNQNNETHTAYAYLLLDTPCTQGAYDYLDIFYRIQFLNTRGQGLSSQAIIDFGGRFFAQRDFYIRGLYRAVCNKPQLPYTYLWYGDDLNAFRGVYTEDGYQYFQLIDTVTQINSHFKYKFSGSLSLDEEVGAIYNMMLQGSSHEGFGVYSYSQFNNPTAPFQNLFTHSFDATVPFFDSLKLASGNGKVLLSGNWTNKWPELYRIVITESGAAGTAKYKWSVRKHLGFSGNSYNDRTARCPFRNPNKPAVAGLHGWRDENNDVLRYSSTEIVQYDDTGVTRLDLLSGSYSNWDATTNPVLPVTQARQVAVDQIGKRIYVGCRNTGLWVIDSVAGTITNPITVPVYGVDVGRNGVAFVIANGALFRSTNWNAPLPFTYAGITDGNWSRVQFLKVDPEHSEDRMAFVSTVAGNNNRRIVWFAANGVPRNTGELKYFSDGDARGVCYWIGTNYGAEAWTNPHTAGRVTCVMSSIDAGNSSLLVNRVGGENNHTSNIANSWMSIDLGAGNGLTPNYYTLRLRGSYGGHAIRNWKLQGSNNVASNFVADLNAATWTDLDVRTNDTTMPDAPDAWGRYAVNGGSTLSYRWLRIIQTGLNSSNANYLILGEFEFYGTFNSSTPSRIPQAGPYPPVAGPERDNIRPWAAAFDVSDTGSHWACYGVGLLDFGTIGVAGTDRDIPTQQLTHSVWGSDRYGKINFYKDNLILRSAICNRFGINQNFFTDLGDTACTLHMDGGIVLTNRYMRQLFTDNSYCWENYGWDGTQWILNGTGTKLTHAAQQSLANGITVGFQNGSNAPHFTLGDFHTQGVCNGLLKDNATRLSYSSAWYSKPTQFGYKVQAGATVPSQPSTGPTTARYWRIRSTNLPGGRDAQWYIREVVFRNASGQDITTEGVLSVSVPDPNSPPSQAIDKNTGSIARVSSSGKPGTIGCTFANSVTITSVSLCHYNDVYYNTPPTAYIVESSSDGKVWYGVWTFTTGTNDNTYYNSTYNPSTNAAPGTYAVILSAAYDPDFVTIEVDSPELINLTLNGQPLATVYTDGIIPPGVNEVYVTAEGACFFNAANAGQAVGGFYSWVRN